MISSCLVRETTDRGEIVQDSSLPEPVRQSGVGRGERKQLLQHLRGGTFLSAGSTRMTKAWQFEKMSLAAPFAGVTQAKTGPPFDRMILIGGIMSLPG